jgi:hypothetical protein
MRYQIDPSFPRLVNLGKRAPRSYVRTLHRLRVDSAMTGSTRFKFKFVDSPYCSTCHTLDDVQHVFLHCRKYTAERIELVSKLHSQHKVMLLNLRVLFNPPCTTDRDLLFRFLRDTGLIDHL